MPWKEVSTEDLAKKAGINLAVVREKQRLMAFISKARKKAKLSPAALAKKVGITQKRVTQIESGVGTSKVTFDLLFSIFRTLGYNLKIIVRDMPKASIADTWRSKKMSK